MLFDESKIKEAVARKAREVRLSGKVDTSLVSSYVRKACNQLNIDPSSVSIQIGYKGGMIMGETIVYLTYSGSSNEQRYNQENDRREENNEPDRKSNNCEVSEGYLPIYDKGQTSLLKQLRLSSGYYKFEIHTRDPSSIMRIIRDEQYKLLEAEEGINSLKADIKGGTKVFNLSFSFGGNSNKDQVIIFEYHLGMPLAQFLDHRKKGIEKSSSIYTQLTHGAKFPADILAFLAFCWLQKNVQYNTEYVERLNKTHKPENDNHMSYGSLVKKIAVCEGYAWGLIHIMEKGGYIAQLACGSRNGSAHAWARVLVNGKWYNVDPTIINPGNTYAINNLLVSDNFLLKQGYKINPHPNAECYDTKYENQKGLIEAVKKRKDELIRQGGDPTILNGSFGVIS